MMHKAWCNIEEVPCCISRSSTKFQGHTSWKIDDLDQIWGRLLGRSQLSNPSELPCWLCSHLWVWPWPWPWAWIFKVKHGSIATKRKANMTLTLNFQGQIWKLLYLNQKWSDCHETKSKHIDWTQGLKGDHGVWPWPPWIFKVKYGNCYISTKNGLIATKRKANISIELKASKVTMGFDLGHDLDLEFSSSNMEFAISLSKSDPKVRCKDLQNSDRGDFWCRRAVDSSSCNMYSFCHLLSHPGIPGVTLCFCAGSYAAAAAAGRRFLFRW